MTTSPADKLPPTIDHIMTLATKMMRDSWTTGTDASWQPAYQALRAAVTAALAAVPAQGVPVLGIDYTPGEWFQADTVDDMERFFLSRLPAIREAAQEHGYAIGLHGSCRRDLDLIAAPWRDGATGADALAHAIAEAACGITRAGTYEWERKPSGRVATSIPICWPGWHGQDGAGHIDLSVMPVAAPAPVVPVEVERDASASRRPGTLDDGAKPL